MGDYWIHDLDPVLFHVWGPIAIRWYGLAYLAGIVTGWWLVRRWARKGLIPMTDQAAADMVLYLGIGMILGGRLGYCLFYDTSLLGFNGDFPWWGVLQVWNGGMASHGGIVGFFVGGWMFARKHKIPIWVLGDGVATVIPIGIIFGRIANFINGELWGRATDVSWAVKFPNSIYIPPEIATYSDEWYQFINLNADPRHPSQLYAVGLEGFMPLLLSLCFYGRHRRPGLNIGIILTVYSIGRVLGEFVREPDEQFKDAGEAHGFVLAQFSMGQLLTIPVFLFGCWFLWNALSKPPKPQLYVRSVDTDPGSASTPSTGKP